LGHVERRARLEGDISKGLFPPALRRDGFGAGASIELSSGRKGRRGQERRAEEIPTQGGKRAVASQEPATTSSVLSYRLYTPSSPPPTILNRFLTLFLPHFRSHLLSPLSFPSPDPNRRRRKLTNGLRSDLDE
jgi:hypothetical protein